MYYLNPGTKRFRIASLWYEVRFRPYLNTTKKDTKIKTDFHKLSIHYDYDKKLARYTLDTAGFADLINAYGLTEMEFIHDFSSDLG